MQQPKILRSIAYWTTVLLAFLSLSACEKLNQFKTPAKLPSFEATLLNGSKISHSEFKGHVSIINFWATTCTVCVKEMPEMVKVFNEFEKQDLKLLAIAMSYDPPMYVVDFTNTRKLPFLVVMDSDGTLSKLFGGIEATPTTFLINKEGRIIKKYVGEPNWAEMRSLIKTALTQ